jgi:hypothetical protein
MARIALLILLTHFSFTILGDETIVESSALSTPDTKYNYIKESHDHEESSDSHILFHIPGLTLTEHGGPLGQSEIRYRGLSGSRLAIDIEGLSLNNPLYSFTDANSLFLFSALELQSSAQSLSITLLPIKDPFAKGIFGYGSHNSFKLGACAGTPLGRYSSFFAATQLSATNGDFSFSNTGDKATFNRNNNDQQRYQALAKYNYDAPSTKAHLLAAFNSHEGGLPGFAFSPTNDLRIKSLFGGLSLGFTKKINKAEFSFTLAQSAFNFHSSEKTIEQEHLLSSTHEFTMSINHLGLPQWLDMELGHKIIIDHSYDHKESRIGGGFFMHRTMRFRGRIKPVIDAYFSMLGYHEHGLLFKKDFNFSIQPTHFLGLTVGFTRSQRLPTFMELYANNAFFEGNKNLSKESLWDFQLGSTLRIAQSMQLNIIGFWGHLSDLIVYEPFNALKLRPKNISSATRMGLDFTFDYEPKPWLLLSSKNSLLRTRIKATNSPLPQAPTFSGLSRLRLGPPDLLALSLQTRYKTSSNANEYGTKSTKGYALFDAILSTKAIDLISLSLSVTNIFNVKNARDTYEMPLPGTAFFAQIEVGNS